MFYRSLVINLKTVRCGLSSSGLLLMKVELLNFFNEKRHLAKLLEDEELYWKQQAKALWLENGDLNTKFFHAQASGRKASNKVSYLVDVNGIVQSDFSTMGSIALSYFRNLFSLGLPNFDGLEISLTDVVNLEDNESLVAPFSKEEFTKAIKQMHSENRRVLMI